MASGKKERIISVIDTNVFIGVADTVFHKLKNRDIVIPLIVLQELEAHRNDDGGRGWACRQVLHYVEDLRLSSGGEVLSQTGVAIDNNSTVRVEGDHTDTTVLGEVNDNKNDSIILAVAKNLAVETKRAVEVITNDLPMRLKASIFLGLDAVSYGDKGVVAPYTGQYKVRIAKPMSRLDDDEILDDITSQVADAGGDMPYHALIEVTDSTDEVDYFLKSGTSIREIDHTVAIGKLHAKNMEQEVAMSYLSDDSIDVISLGGVAGAGKSLLALAEGLREVKNGKVSKVIVFRSMYEVGRQKVGYLPGTLEEKIAPWAQAVWDNVATVDRINSGRSKKNAVTEDDVKKLHEKDVEVSPISFVRGRTISDAFIIVDDAQSLDRIDLLDIVSRLGKGSRIVFTFDMEQNDNPYLSQGTSILSLINDLRSREVAAHIDFTHSERSELAQLASELLRKG